MTSTKQQIADIRQARYNADLAQYVAGRIWYWSDSLNLPYEEQRALQLAKTNTSHIAETATRDFDNFMRTLSSQYDNEQWYKYPNEDAIQAGIQAAGYIWQPEPISGILQLVRA